MGISIRMLAVKGLLLVIALSLGARLRPSPPTTQGEVLNDEKEDLEEMNLTNTTEAPSKQRIIGGWEARRNNLPYMAGIWVRPGESWTGAHYVCGGSLISNKDVLTAAHCTKALRAEFQKFGLDESFLLDNWLIVILGAHELDPTVTDPRKREVKVCNIVEHPESSPDDITFDIAILSLCEEVTPTMEIYPVCLPPPNFQDENRGAAFYGWGLTADGKQSEVLKTTWMWTKDNGYCFGRG